MQNGAAAGGGDLSRTLSSITVRRAAGPARPPRAPPGRPRRAGEVEAVGGVGSQGPARHGDARGLTDSPPTRRRPSPAQLMGSKEFLREEEAMVRNLFRDVLVR